MPKIAVLKITCWSFSIGGEHFTGIITGYDANNAFKQVEVMHALSVKEALALNRKDGAATYHPGEMSGRFSTPEQLEKEAVKIFQNEFPHYVALSVGSWAVADPQRIIFGPDALMKPTNELVEEWQRIGGYEGDEKRCDELFKQYRQLLKDLEITDH